MEPLVSVEWLAEHREDPDIRVFDTTVQVARHLFLATARNGEREVSPRAHPRQRHHLHVRRARPRPPKVALPAPSPEHFAAALGSAV